jgi:hypothetical protein
VFAVGNAAQAQLLLAEAAPAQIHGVGRATAARLNALGGSTCVLVEHKIGLKLLQKEFGDEMGRQLLCIVRGQDPVAPAYNVWKVVGEVPKSIQNEIAYNIRPHNAGDVKELIRHILELKTVRSAEVEEVAAGSITLKVKYRRAGEQKEPTKKGGCGRCDQWTKSVQLTPPSATIHALYTACLKMLKGFDAAAPDDIRGLGISLTKLSKRTSAGSGRGLDGFGGGIRSGGAGGAIGAWMATATTNSGNGGCGGTRTKRAWNDTTSQGSATSSRAAARQQEQHEPVVTMSAWRGNHPKLPANHLPPQPAHAPVYNATEIDASVFDALPPEVQAELQQAGMAPLTTATLPDPKRPCKNP